MRDQLERRYESGQELSRNVRLFLVALTAFSLGISLSILVSIFFSNQEITGQGAFSSESGKKIQNNIVVLKLNKFIQQFSKEKSQDEIINNLSYLEIQKKITEFEKDQKAIIKEKLDENDFNVKKNPNQLIVNDFVMDFISSKKEWIKKVVYLDNTKKNTITLFSRVKKCDHSYYVYDKKETFENTHCFDQRIFFQLSGKWIVTGRHKGISWFDFYKNRPVIDIELSDIQESIESNTLITIFVGIEDNNDEVFGLSLNNNIYSWMDFSSTNWEDVSDEDLKTFEKNIERNRK